MKRRSDLVRFCPVHSSAHSRIGVGEAFLFYFEDFDLSLRAAACGELAYVSSVTMIHWGGY